MSLRFIAPLSRGPVHLLAFLAVTLVLGHAGVCGMTTLCADEPAFQSLQHGPEVLTQDAIRTSNNFAGHHAAPLKTASTSIPHWFSSHSGT